MFKLRRIVLISICVLLTLPLVLAQAQDTCTYDLDDGSGLPLCGSPNDNECNPGGLMEGTCTSLDSWIGGWYLARYRQGLISLEEFPEKYIEVLAFLPADETPEGDGDDTGGNSWWDDYRDMNDGGGDESSGSDSDSGSGSGSCSSSVSCSA